MKKLLFVVMCLFALTSANAYKKQCGDWGQFNAEEGPDGQTIHCAERVCFDVQQVNGIWQIVGTSTEIMCIV